MAFILLCDDVAQNGRTLRGYQCQVPTLVGMLPLSRKRMTDKVWTKPLALGAAIVTALLLFVALKWIWLVIAES